MTSRQIEDAVLKMDRALRRDDAALRAAVIMLSGLQVGTTQHALVKFTGYQREFVRGVCNSLRRNKIFDGDKGDWRGVVR